MPLSKSTRIILLLTIDAVFFLVELTVGMWFHDCGMERMLTSSRRLFSPFACACGRLFSHGKL